MTAGGEEHPGGWLVEQARGTASGLHAASAALVGPDGERRRKVRVLEATAPAVVLGAAQPEDHVDRRAAERLGVEVVRRRSGGAAVLVGPGEVLWVDLVVPPGDPLWADDVGRAAWWVGELWAGALAAVGAPGPASPEVWRGPMVRGPWSSRVCFAGTGPGEVVAGAGRPGCGATGAKVVGVSQRRARGGALFQCAALLRWRPADLLGVLDLGGAHPASVARKLAGAGLGVGPELAPGLLGAVLSGLPGD